MESHIATWTVEETNTGQCAFSSGAAAGALLLDSQRLESDSLLRHLFYSYALTLTNLL